jgi:hypothetical protein
MKCQRCNGVKKMYAISAKCSDLYSQVHLSTQHDYEGYVPEWIGGGDYINFTICRHCGQVQGSWPESDSQVDKFKYGKANK